MQKIDVSKLPQKNEADIQHYKSELYEKANFAEGLRNLEKENKWFKKFINWISQEIEKEKNNLLICEDEEVLKIRFEARGKQAILRQLEIIQREGDLAKKKLEELNK